MIAPYLTDIMILLAASVIAVPFFKAIKIGAISGFLIAGVIVGPAALGLINNVQAIGQLAEIGVVLLLFGIGAELKPSRLWRMRRLVFGLGSFQFLGTGLIIGCVTHLFFNIPLRISILIGAVLALSSTAFVLQLLSEQKMLTSIYGRTSFSVLLLQDLAVVPLLVLVPLLAMPELHIGKDIGFAMVESILFLSLVILLGHYFLKPVFHRVARSDNSEVFTASAVLLVLGAALITEHLGLSMAMGAFLAGLLVSDSPYKHQIMAEIHPFRGLLLGLFFMSMGMQLNVSLLVEQPLQSLSLVGLLIALKTMVLFSVAYSFGLPKNKCLAVALLLSQSGEFALILFSLAYQTEFLSDALFQQLLLTVLLSMLLTPLLAHMAHRLVKHKKQTTVTHTETPVVAPIVLAGFGRVGRRIGEVLTIAEKPFIALDADASIVEQERKKGYPVYYGDVRNTSLLESAGAANAKVILVTTSDPTITKQVVESLRRNHPKTKIYVRGHSLTECCELRKMGASGAVSETVEASLELARMALSDLNMQEQHSENILESYRKNYHSKINHTHDQLSQKN